MAHRAALAFAADAIAIGGVDLRQGDGAGKARADRPDLHRDFGPQPVFAVALQRLAAGNALAQHRRIIERLPYRVARRGDPLLAGHPHQKRAAVGVSVSGLRVPSASRAVARR